MANQFLHFHTHSPVGFRLTTFRYFRINSSLALRERGSFFLAANRTKTENFVLELLLPLCSDHPKASATNVEPFESIDHVNVALPVKYFGDHNIATGR